MSSSASTGPAVRFEDVSFRYGSAKRGYSLLGIRLEIRPGETCALMGHNGSGKTTLLRLCAGLVRPSSGSVTIRTNGKEERVRGPRRDVGYIPQHLGLLRSSSVLHNVLLGCLGRLSSFQTLLGTFPSDEREHALLQIERVGLSHKANERVHRLSGGQRQRVAIARTLMQRPRLLLADEFASNLDPVRQRESLQLVRDGLSDDHVATIMALHNVELAKRFADRILFLKQGAIVADMPADDVTPELAEWHLQN